MAIDYNSLFSSNFFTRAQVEVLIRLSELLIAEGGGGGGVSDPLKADKTLVLAVGTGLTGGGDLSANRTFSLDLSFLDGRYPKITDGKISAAVLPSIATSDSFPVASEAAMLALAANKGDIAIRSDVNKTFVLSAEPATTLANWLEMLTPGAAVASFAGRTGTVTPTAGDYTFAMIGSPPTTRAGYGITDAEGTIAAGTTAQYWRGDKSWQALDKAAVGLGNVDDTSDNAKPLGTAQLATLAAGTGAGLLGTLPPGTGGIVRDLNTVLHEGRLSLRGYALANGTDETASVQNWLNALAANNRKGYVPTGTYKIGDLSITGDHFDIECHPNAKFEALTGGTNPVIKFLSSTGTAAIPAGTVRWVGGKVDAAIRDYTTEGTGVAVLAQHFAKVTVRDATITGAADHEAGETAGKGGHGIRVYACGRGTVSGNTITGFREGVSVSGGTDTGTSDDGAGITVTDNDIVKCKYGVVATRAARDVIVEANRFDQCEEGVLATPGDTAVPAARVSVLGNRFYRPGKSMVHLRLQNGFTVAGNVALDFGYKLDGTTVHTAGTVRVINLEGCKGGEVQGNVIRMDALSAQSQTYGVHNTNYTFNSVTTEPQEVAVHNNNISGVETGASEAGATSTGNRYSENTFSQVTTEYADIPAAARPYGTYTPTATNVTNIAASVPGVAMWRRSGPDITVYVYGTVDPTATGNAEIELDLPVDPGYNFVNDYDLIGTSYSGTTGTGAHFIAKTGDRKARWLLNYETDVANHSWTGVFTYRTLPTVAAPPPPGGLSTLHLEDGTTPIHLEDGTTIIEV